MKLRKDLKTKEQIGKLKANTTSQFKDVCIELVSFEHNYSKVRQARVGRLVNAIAQAGRITENTLHATFVGSGVIYCYAGRHRILAAQETTTTKIDIPAEVRVFKTEEDMLAWIKGRAVTANYEMRLSFFERVDQIRSLSEDGLKHREISGRLGLDERTVRDCRYFLSLNIQQQESLERAATSANERGSRITNGSILKVIKTYLSQSLDEKNWDKALSTLTSKKPGKPRENTKNDAPRKRVICSHADRVKISNELSDILNESRTNASRLIDKLDNYIIMLKGAKK